MSRRPPRPASVKDVGALAGVSVGSVSNYLNHPERVSRATAERIAEAIQELGFVRNDAARQLRAGDSQAVAMVVLDVGNPFFTDIARGVEKALVDHPRPLILADSSQDSSKQAAYLDLFEQQRVSGILITPVGDVLPRLRQLRDRGMAIVLIDRRLGVREFSSVSVDDKLGGRLATQHLLDIGRRRIAVLGGSDLLTQVRDRRKAARDIVRSSGVDAHLSFVGTETQDADAGRAAAEELLALPASERPDAIFAVNDLLALGVLQALTLAGVSVPDDIALIGYDDIEFAASAAIPLSSVRQPREEIGRRAAQRLASILAANDDERPRQTVLKPELVVRRSTQVS